MPWPACRSRCAPRSRRSTCRSTDILSLAPGSVIRLGAQAEHGVSAVCRERQARPGTARIQRPPPRDPDLRHRGEVGDEPAGHHPARSADPPRGLHAPRRSPRCSRCSPRAGSSAARSRCSPRARPRSRTSRAARSPRACRYIDGVTGANIFVMTAAGARSLAGAMGVAAEDDQEDDQQLSEFEMSAIGRGRQPDDGRRRGRDRRRARARRSSISPPDTRVLDDPDSRRPTLYGTAPHATSTTFLIAGESCRLIQLVPSAFVVRMARAIDELSAEQRPRRTTPPVGQRRAGGAGRPAQRRQRGDPGDARRHQPARLGRARTRADAAGQGAVDAARRGRRPRPRRRRPGRPVRKRHVLRPGAPARDRRRRVGRVRR